jgi:ABC transporter substrate binding protein (PQQ-dependent alcohol dehydrogenase system)
MKVIRPLLACCAVGLTFMGLPVAALSAELQTVNIALIEYEEDPRYKDNIIDARYQAQPWGRLEVAAKLAIKESRFAAQKKGVKFELDRQSVSELSALPELIQSLEAQGTQYFLLDLPGEGVKQVAQASKKPSSLLFNLSALDNNLRNEYCQANLLHIAPSQRMLTDAMAQYLVAKKWKEVLVLYSESEADTRYLKSLQTSAKKFGVDIVNEKPFKLGNDPRQRYRNNISLLTAKDDYDVVYVVDHSGEFAVDVPYSIIQPRPVVGAAGLVADWWHWAWERNGAPQVNKRFMKKGKRQMTGYDWSAWMAVKVIAEGVLRQETFAPNQLLDTLLDKEFKLDGAKGYPLNFKPWNHQLRQPVFLTSLNRVIDRAPVEGFLHPVNNLDVLGNDRGEGQCDLSKSTASGAK